MDLVITPVIESLIVPFKKHLCFLVSSTKYVKDMNKKMDQLEVTRKEVQDDKDKALVHTEVVPAHAEPWLQEVENLNERRNLIEATGCFNVKKRYTVGKQSYGILQEIKDLENQKESKIVFTHEKICLAEVGSTFIGTSTPAPVPMGSQNNFESRVSVFNDALQALQSNNESQRMIALCGMAGVGKTTMMERLKKAAEEKDMFKRVVKVVIGQNTDTIAIQQAIAEYIISNDLTETTEYARADRLRKMFEGLSEKGTKKILVIMDDLWKKVDLEDVGLSPLPNGFKLLLTSQYEYVCTEMGVKTCSIFNVRALDEKEAEDLFFGIAGPCDDLELQRIGKDIVMKCGGLPKAIITIANSLSGNIKEAWEYTLSELQHYDLQCITDIVDNDFKRSYNNLKSDDDKALFLLTGLFPDDFNIPIEDLMVYGWGLKLFTNVRNLAEARTKATVCVNNLKRANLLTKSDRMGCVKVHELLRAFVLRNFSNVKQASFVNHADESMQFDAMKEFY